MTEPLIDKIFEEVLADKDEGLDKNESLYLETYVSSIQPKHCASLLKELATRLPLGGGTDKDHITGPETRNLSHLKRVRRSKISTETKEQAVNAEESSNINQTENRKRKRESNGQVQLQVVLASVLYLDSNHGHKEWLSEIISKYSLQLEKKFLPGRPAQSLEELEKFNQMWPTIYFHKQSKQFQQEEQQQLSNEEIEMMKWGLEQAVQDASKSNCRIDKSQTIAGAVICCPQSRTVVASAGHERVEQEQQLGGDNNQIPRNPLMTPILLAIQGVSRIERHAAMGHGMDSTTFKNGQYLCTGYDLYTTREPNIFEAMALVHSRIRRVVFGVVDAQEGGLGGTTIKIHSLPGTNHKYRVFSCCEKTELAQTCEKLHSNGSKQKRELS